MFMFTFQRPDEGAIVQSFGRHLLASDTPISNNTFYNATGCLVYLDSVKVEGKAIDLTDIGCDVTTNET